MDHMITLTPHFGNVRISSWEMGYAGGNTTGSKVCSESVKRYADDESMVLDFAFEYYGPFAEVRKGDARHAWIVSFRP